jgi:hypothetical protein
VTLIPKEPRLRGVSKDEGPTGAPCFETAARGLLSMRKEGGCSSYLFIPPTYAASLSNV